MICGGGFHAEGEGDLAGAVVGFQGGFQGGAGEGDAFDFGGGFEGGEAVGGLLIEAEAEVAGVLHFAL